jgi:hypothetical protein
MNGTISDMQLNTTTTATAAATAQKACTGGQQSENFLSDSWGERWTGVHGHAAQPQQQQQRQQPRPQGGSADQEHRQQTRLRRRWTDTSDMQLSSQQQQQQQRQRNLAQGGRQSEAPPTGGCGETVDRCRGMQSATTATTATFERRWQQQEEPGTMNNAWACT